jgi:tetratricopeptide (TPR) repeat protein
VGAWQLAHGNRFACTVPEARLANAWASDTADARRQSIHRAFSFSGRHMSETSWERVSKVLDEYMTAWRAMYVQACEATHARGEQSAEVLDMRMSCLNDNLDQVHALTNAFLTSNASALSNAVATARGLTSVSRCADVALLRSAVPLPREETALREVQRLRRALTDIQTLWDIGDAAGALKRAHAIRPEVEATGFKPLLGELLQLVGIAESAIDEDSSRSEKTLREAMLVAQAARDDRTAAKVCAILAFVNGFRLGRFDEGEFWAGLADATLDRLGAADPRLRAWINEARGGSLARAGHFEAARVVVERGARLKEEILGSDHPDYATSLGALAYVLVRGGHGKEALDVANRAINIAVTNGDPEAFSIGQTYANQGEALYALGRYSEADEAFQRSLRNLTKNVGRMHPETAFALQGLGEVRLAQKQPLDAIPLFADALLIRQRPQVDPVLTAESEFGLARALWDGGLDRPKARRLATAALVIYTREQRENHERSVRAWLANHRARDGYGSLRFQMRSAPAGHMTSYD